jgi:two-component system cell cycle sensor histidine kinase/response regulator CckA
MPHTILEESTIGNRLDEVLNKIPKLGRLRAALLGAKQASTLRGRKIRSATAPDTARLLIVDGEPTQMISMCEALEVRGYAITWLTSAAAALATLREQVFDLVLADLHMPEMDGIAFLRAARQIDSDLVGIVMTGQDAEDHAAQAMEAGALDYIIKPFDLSAVLPVLARARGVRQLRLENIHLQQAVGIYELSMVIRLTLDFEAVLQKVADAAMEHAQVTGVSILLPTEDGKALRVAVARGENAAGDEGKRIPFSRAVSRWVERSLKRVSRMNELAAVQAALPLLLSQMPGSASIAMLSGGRFVGILSFTSRNPGRPVSPEQIKALNILAGAAASALEAASLLEQMRSAERRYRSLAESAPDIIFRYELRPQPHVAYVNPAFASTFGYSPDEWHADPELILKIVHPEDRHLKESVLRGDFTNGSTITLRCINRNGNTVWIEQRNTRVLDPDGRLIAIEGIARDITERHLLEDQLRQSQKMEAIGLLAGGLAHDFNNMLTVIIGYSDLILSDDAPSVQIVAKVDQVKRAAEHAAALTGQLLAFGRRQIVQRRVLDVNTIVESTSLMLRRSIGEDIELVTSLDAGLESIKADAGQIEQILMNLVVNAKDAMPAGGKITIETKNVTLDEPRAAGSPAGDPKPYVMLAVKDSGCGMDASTQARIFEPFYTTKELGKGTGLGLSIIYGIVKQSSGHIRVISELGQGARFEILLPRCEKMGEIREIPAACAEPTTGTETVLVVEDEPGVRQLIAKVLQNRGYDVRIARDGNEALRLCEEHEGEIGLILTDMIMPGMSGPALVESLRKLHPAMRVLYMSGYAGDVLASDRGLDPGIPFIQKPFTSVGLLTKIREVLDRAPSQSATE